MCNNKSKKGFTLIELMMVISIIGILSSIILVNLNGAKNKAKDAAIMAAAQTIMKAAQIDSSGTNDYSSWNKGWLHDSAYPSCSDMPVATQQACQSIRNNAGTTYLAGNPEFKLFVGQGGSVPSNPRLTIMAALPGKKKFYCIGSNGGSSATTELNGVGCGGNWLCSGCYFDPNGGGS